MYKHLQLQVREPGSAICMRTLLCEIVFKDSAASTKANAEPLRLMNREYSVEKTINPIRLAKSPLSWIGGKTCCFILKIQLRHGFEIRKLLWAVLMSLPIQTKLIMDLWTFGRAWYPQFLVKRVLQTWNYRYISRAFFGGKKAVNKFMSCISSLLIFQSWTVCQASAQKRKLNQT